MLRSARSGMCVRFASSDQGGYALPTVLTAILVMLVMGAAVTAQAVSELRAGRLERDVAQKHIIINSAMDEASLLAWSDPDFGEDMAAFPDPTEAVPATWQPCTPQPMDPLDPNGPQYCVDYLRRNDTTTVRVGGTTLNCATTGHCGVIPVRIRYMLTASAAGSPHSEFGWLVVQFTNSTRNQVRSVRTYFEHEWCRESIGVSPNLCG